MPYFKWRGVDIVGAWHAGKQFAKSHEHLDALLLKKQIALVGSKPISASWFVRSIGMRDIAQFFRQLSVLINAGVLLPEALGIAGQQVGNPRLQEVVYAVADAVQEGLSFGVALQRYPRVFTKIMVQLVQAGEESGKLAPALEALCGHLEATDEFYERIRSALMMPVITFAFFCLISIVMFVFIIPRFVHIFTSMKISLPPLTQALLSISGGVRQYGFFIVVALSVCGIGLWAWRRTVSGKRVLDFLCLRIPFVGTLLRHRFTAYFFHSLGMLLEGGMQLVPALGVVRQSTDNSVFAMQVACLQEAVDAGDPLSEALLQSTNGLFAHDAVAMVLVGQESGSLPMVLQKVAAGQREKIKRSLVAATTLVQPVLMLILGLLVTLLVFAIYVPIFNLSYSF